MKLNKVFLGIVLGASCTFVAAQPTEVTVRVLSKDAKFIGTSMSGARITLSDAKTGEILATGVTEGGTGDTRRIVIQPRRRGAVLATPKAAKFSVTLDLAQPTLIRAEAHGPLSNPDSANTVSATQWMIPGKPINGGDGWILEIPGFSVEASAKTVGAGGEITFFAEVKMMCGCPIEPDGLWDANQYDVGVWVRRDDEKVMNIPLQYAGKTSRFRGTVDGLAPGAYEAVVYAHDAGNGNTGADRVQFTVAK